MIDEAGITEPEIKKKNYTTVNETEPVNIMRKKNQP